MAVIYRSEVQEPRSTHVDVQTRETVWALTFRGLTAAEATNLTAYLCGIGVGKGGWTLSEINGLLFLRDLSRRGQFGPTDASPTAN